MAWSGISWTRKGPKRRGGCGVREGLVARRVVGVRREEMMDREEGVEKRVRWCAGGDLSMKEMLLLLMSVVERARERKKQRSFVRGGVVVARSADLALCGNFFVAQETLCLRRATPSHAEDATAARPAPHICTSLPPCISIPRCPQTAVMVVNKPALPARYLGRLTRRPCPSAATSLARTIRLRSPPLLPH